MLNYPLGDGACKALNRHRAKIKSQRTRIFVPAKNYGSLIFSGASRRLDASWRSIPQSGGAR